MKTVLFENIGGHCGCRFADLSTVSDARGRAGDSKCLNCVESAVNCCGRVFGGRYLEFAADFHG
jgi:hypothetical protein